MWSGLRPDRFTPGKEPPGDCIGDWMGPTTGLDNLVKRKIQLFQDLNADF
jgi:hypothetical protein